MSFLLLVFYWVYCEIFSTFLWINLIWASVMFNSLNICWCINLKWPYVRIILWSLEHIKKLEYGRWKRYDEREFGYLVYFTPLLCLHLVRYSVKYIHSLVIMLRDIYHLFYHFYRTIHMNICSFFRCKNRRNCTSFVVDFYQILYISLCLIRFCTFFDVCIRIYDSLPHSLLYVCNI